MYQGDEPPLQHHLPKMDDDDDDDNDNHHTPYPFPGYELHNHPTPHTTPPQHHHRNPPKRSPTPPPRPQQPLQPPQPLHPEPPLQPPTPILLQPPQPIPQTQSSPPPPTPRKPRPPPPMKNNHNHHHHDDDDDDEKYKKQGQQVAAVIAILLLLFGLAALIIWLVYHPHKPHFTATAVAIYSLNITSPPFISAAVQFNILTTNPNKRTSLYYDSLSATVYYRHTPITPPVALPPLHHLKKSRVMIAPVIGGGPPVAVPVPVGPDVVNGLAADEAYGVVGLSWVMVGRVRYRAGSLRSGHSRVYVRCDVMVGLRGVGVAAPGVFTNPNGILPLLGSPPCFVDF